MQDEEEVASSARDSSRGQKLDGCSWAAQAWGWTIFVIPDLTESGPPYLVFEEWEGSRRAELSALTAPLKLLILSGLRRLHIHNGTHRLASTKCSTWNTLHSALLFHVEHFPNPFAW